METLTDRELFVLRQQLSADNLELLDSAAAREESRLEALRWEFVAARVPSDVLDAHDERVAKLKLARRQLAFVYIDQFKACRVENDQAGRLGLRRE